LSNLVDLCREIFHAPKIKITYTPHTSAIPTLGVRKNMPYHSKIFYRLNKCSKFFDQYLSISFLLQAKKDLGYAKIKEK